MSGSTFFTTEELAAYCRTSPSTCRYWRAIGYGPKGVRVGRRVLYEAAEEAGNTVLRCHDRPFTYSVEGLLCVPGQLTRDVLGLGVRRGPFACPSQGARHDQHRSPAAVTGGLPATA